MCSQIHSTQGILCQMILHGSTLVTEGVIIDSRNSGIKMGKNKCFQLILVQQLQTLEILHCSKLLKNIKIRILCNMHVSTLGRFYDWVL